MNFALKTGELCTDLAALCNSAFFLQCMTPPHSPDLVEMSAAVLLPSQVTYSKPRTVMANTAACLLTSTTDATPAAKPSVLSVERQCEQRAEASAPQPCRAMATSVIRHTGDSSAYHHGAAVREKAKAASGCGTSGDRRGAEGRRRPGLPQDACAADAFISKASLVPQPCAADCSDVVPSKDSSQSDLFRHRPTYQRAARMTCKEELPR